MAAGTTSSPVVNGHTGTVTPIELAIDLPQSPGTRVNVHLTIHKSSLVLFIATTNTDAASGATSLGSFVYAMPDRYNSTQPMSTALYSLPSSLDFATRMAKVLARRLKLPCYVGGSLDLSGAAGGGTVDEEMEAFHSIVRVVMAEYEKCSAN